MSKGTTTATPTLTRSIVVEAFNRFDRILEAWDKDDSQSLLVHWAGRMVKGMTQELINALEGFLDDTADAGKEVEIEATTILMAIDEFEREYDDFRRGFSEEKSHCKPSGSIGLWTAYNRIKDAISQKMPDNRKPPSIASLLKQEVTHGQIAMIYGWQDESRTPDYQKVMEEIETPGTHYDPDKWVSPAYTNRLEIMRREWNTRMRKRDVKYSTYKPAPKSTGMGATMEEMVQLDAPAEQIARCFDVTIEHANELLAAERERKDLEKKKRESRVDSTTADNLAAV